MPGVKRADVGPINGQPYLNSYKPASLHEYQQGRAWEPVPYQHNLVEAAYPLTQDLRQDPHLRNYPYRSSGCSYEKPGRQIGASPYLSGS